MLITTPLLLWAWVPDPEEVQNAVLQDGLGVRQPTSPNTPVRAQVLMSDGYSLAILIEVSEDLTTGAVGLPRCRRAGMPFAADTHLELS